MSCLLKDFLKQFALEPGEMLSKLLDSQDQDINSSEALKYKTKSFDLNARFLFWGILAQNTEQETAQDVVYHALLLDTANVHDPYSKACYSAIELFKLLKHLDNIQVYLENPTHQQYRAVMIHTQDGRFVYDPIKDPKRVFTEDEYKATPPQYTVLMNQPLLLMYETLQAKYLNYLEENRSSSDLKNEKRRS